MSDELLRDLPGTLPAFVERFGTDAECRAYLIRALWPEGFCCAGCGHREAWSHKKRLIEECCSCGKQDSILAGTMFEQTKTGLAKWFLAIYLVTSSKGGISAMELQRQPLQPAESKGHQPRLREANSTRGQNPADDLSRHRTRVAA